MTNLVLSKLEIAIEAKQAQIDAAKKELAELRKDLRRVEALAKEDGA